MASCTDYPRNHSMAPELPRRDFADGATWGHRIVRELEAGASGWIYWNLALDDQGGPFLLSPDHGDADDNYQHPVIVVDRDGSDYHPTGLFWFLAHFSKFVRPGVRRAKSRAALPDLVDAVAFRGVNETVVQLVNRGSEAATVAVCDGAGVARLEVPGEGVVTGVW